MELNHYQKYIAILAPYSITVSLLYLFGYWGAFDVNILEYIDLSDVLKNSIYQLIYSSIFIVLGLIIGNLVIAPKMSRVLPPDGGKDLPEAKYFRFMIRLTYVVVIAGIIYTILFTASDSRWFRAAAMSTMLIPLLVGNAEPFSNFIPAKWLRIAVVNIMAAILLYSFGWGALDAVKIKKNENTVTINGEAINKIYAGRAGNHIFLWEKENETIEIIQANLIERLEYKVPPSKAVLAWFEGEERKPNKKINRTENTSAQN